MIPKELVELLFINFCINPFHMQEAWKIKLFFAKSSLIKGTNSSIFVLRGLFFNNSHSDMSHGYSIFQLFKCVYKSMVYIQVMER